MASDNTENAPLSGGLQRDNAGRHAYLQSMREQALAEGRDFIPLFLPYQRFHWVHSLGPVNGVLIWMGASLSPLVASLLFWTQWRHFLLSAVQVQWWRRLVV